MSYQANRKPIIRGRQPVPRAPVNLNRPRSSPNSELDQVSKKRRVIPEIRSPELKGQECKIQVVVRCRGFTDEDGARSLPGVSLPTGSTTEIHCRSGEDMPKVYTFDHVYGPSAPQRTIFEKVASPIVDQLQLHHLCLRPDRYREDVSLQTDEVNVSHTIEGKLEDVHMIPVGDAGIIPRVLFRLFESLNALPPPHAYTVRLSMLEVYNEEVFDLLALQDSVAPMDKLNLKMGPNNILSIEKLQEMLILTPEDGINYLKQGSKQRQKTATRLNSSSSRSHCIMTLLVKQEVPSEGGVVERVGKLNLVDLAGSEDIGRSGAVDQQAKEAGKINQSLLALGKIISLLYKNTINNTDERPLYRDSKLTRILQDSLGGGTRTCIIATISMAYIDMKETLSTLKYANQAKSITNQVKTMVPKAPFVLYEEYREEAKRLKFELKMIQDQDGIKLSAEEYVKLKQAESTLSVKLETFEEKYRSLYSENTELKELSLRKSNELSEIKGELNEAQNKLDASQNEIKTLAARLAHANDLNKAYAINEKQLDSAAQKLCLAAQQRDSYISLLRASLDQTVANQISNRDLMHKMINELASEISTQRIYLDNFSNELLAHETSFLGQVKAAKEKISSQISFAIAELGNHANQSHNSLVAIQDQDGSNLARFKELLQKTSKDKEELVDSISTEICNVLDTMERFKSDNAINSEKHRSKLDQFQTNFTSWVSKECSEVKQTVKIQAEELEASHDKYTKLQTRVYSQLKDQLDDFVNWSEAAKKDFEIEKKSFVDGVQALASTFASFGQQRLENLSKKHTEQLESHTQHLRRLDVQSKHLLGGATSKISTNADQYCKQIQHASILNNQLINAANGYHTNVNQNITDIAKDLSAPCNEMAHVTSRLKSEVGSELNALLDTHHSSRTKSLNHLYLLNESLPPTVERCGQQIQVSTHGCLDQTAQTHREQSTQAAGNLEFIKSHSNATVKTLEKFPVQELNPDVAPSATQLDDYPTSWPLVEAKPFVKNHPTTPVHAIRSNLRIARPAKRNGSLNKPL